MARNAIDFSKPLTATPTPIPGVVLYDLSVHGDNRGWFKENWQRAKMLDAGLPDFAPVQNNISFNGLAGTTRGIHAEPWDKFISVATGRIFGAWVDLRQGPSFGTVFSTELDPSQAIFIPRGVGNAFQTLEDNTAYTYLVNDHWSADAQSEYTFLNLADETANITWPIPLDRAELSEKDKNHPRLAGVAPMPAKKTVVTGADGQLGHALRAMYTGRDDVVFLTRAELDITDATAVAAWDWRAYNAVINAAAYTAVDQAETTGGRAAAWAVNATGPANLARAANTHRLTLVHVSTDYVFDGTRSGHSEDEPFTPLGVYGQSKAAGDTAVSVTPRHYILRTSWVIGAGSNFVRTMASLADGGITPAVVSDQRGRLTFTEDLAVGIDHLLRTGAPFGTYNLSNDGDATSWADIAKTVYSARGKAADDVSEVSTEEFFAGKDAAPRPMQSVLDLSKITSTGFRPRLAAAALKSYLETLD